MTVIYNNIPANTATPYEHTVTGCENQVLFKANNWGAAATSTRLKIESYSLADATKKLTEEFISDIAGFNNWWCPPCLSKGTVLVFSIDRADPVTTALFVEILEPGCKPSTNNSCFEIPFKLVPCP